MEYAAGQEAVPPLHHHATARGSESDKVEDWNPGRTPISNPSTCRNCWRIRPLRRRACLLHHEYSFGDVSYPSINTGAGRSRSTSLARFEMMRLFVEQEVKPCRGRFLKESEATPRCLRPAQWMPQSPNCGRRSKTRIHPAISSPSTAWGISSSDRINKAWRRAPHSWPGKSFSALSHFFFSRWRDGRRRARIPRSPSNTASSIRKARKIPGLRSPRISMVPGFPVFSSAAKTALWLVIRPDWKKAPIAGGGYHTVDGECGDIDGDGDLNRDRHGILVRNRGL